MTDEKDYKEETTEKTDTMADQQEADNVAENVGGDATADDTEQEAAEQDPLEAAQQQIAELKDRLLRQVAEFDNYRKRTLKERAELILNGGEKTIVALLPVLDDMERARKNGEETDDPQVLREGMELICHKMMKVLEAQGVSIIETEDAVFDTDLHEAVAMVPGMGDEKKGRVIDCLATGYKLNDKVIRHAKVAVGQ